MLFFWGIPNFYFLYYTNKKDDLKYFETKLKRNIKVCNASKRIFDAEFELMLVKVRSQLKEVGNEPVPW